MRISDWSSDVCSSGLGRQVLTVLLNAMMGLPPVVVGLVIYLLLSRAGPLGVFGLLFTPTAMIIAQTVLITPIIAALARQDRQSVVSGQSVSVRVDIGGRRSIKKTQHHNTLEPI